MKASTWFPYPRKHPYAPLVLYCLPCAGAGATIYRSWREMAPSTIEVTPVELPGRGRRFREPPIADIGPLLDALMPEIDADSDGRPLALFGHSMGAIVAFELAQRLGSRVRRLFVSGAAAPHLRIVKERSSLSDDALKRELAELGGTPPEILADAEMMDLVMPMLRADFALVETYPGPGDTPLRCPVTVFAGTHDRYVDEAGARAWESYATAGYRFVPVEGHHFYLDTAAPTILREIGSDLEDAPRT